MKAAIVSDIHFHPWSQFSNTLSTGVNSRLQIVIDELIRAGGEILAQGGQRMIIAGDVFHTRGSMDPEVLNPVRTCFDRLMAMGLNIIMIPGNHDLKSNDTCALSSAVQNLEQMSLDGREIEVINGAYIDEIGDAVLGFVPWRWNKEALMKDLEQLSKDPGASQAHVFIHAGIDGVISGMPGSGLTPAELSAFGFAGVYAGHYHNHADMSAGLPNRVMSIGATTHHSWRDVGSRAGFLILDTDKNAVEFHDSHAPKFVDVSGLDEFEMELECVGNYVRYRGPQMTQEEVNELRDQFVKWGALGVSIDVPRKVQNIRVTAPSTGLSLDQSVAKFVGEQKDLPPGVSAAEVEKRALEVLNDARAVSTEA